MRVLDIIHGSLYWSRIDYRRLSTRLGVIDEDDFRKVKEAFTKLYKQIIQPEISEPLRGFCLRA